MKKIIDGKRYDTETAEEVASWSYGNHGDFNRAEETLYRTKHGRWFLHGEGGPRSRFARTVRQNEWSGGSTIEALTEAEAKAWLERNSANDALETYFGDQIEDA
jgi:hypothetical protein